VTELRRSRCTSRFKIRSDEIRAAQGYIGKFPRALLEAMGRGRSARLLSEQARLRHLPKRARDTYGVEYRAADEHVTTQTRMPFSVDPNLVDRGTRGHARAQNHLATGAIHRVRTAQSDAANRSMTSHGDTTA